VILFGYTLWLALSWNRVAPSKPVDHPHFTSLAWAAAGLVALIYIQIILGAFVAGLNAGMAYNTWPLMDGAVIPHGLTAMQPFWLNLFENAMTVQFNHRIMAYATVLAVLIYAIWVLRTGVSAKVKNAALFLAAAVLAQTLLGIWTLLAQVPLHLGLLHQAGAVVLFGLAIFNLRRVFNLRHEVHLATIVTRPLMPD
jgi:cytochrome c oxidase assembly protein subunit 15